MKLNQCAIQTKSLALTNPSQMDYFLRMEDHFLQKFFQYNLIDYFHTLLHNLHDLIHGQSTKKIDKFVASSLYITQDSFNLQDFEQNVNNFYKQRSKSISKEELPYAFKLCYCGEEETSFQIKKGELMFLKVKIKADIEKIQSFPLTILESLKYYRQRKKHNLTELETYLSKYQGQFLNVFIVIFGDTNHQVLNKENYKIEKTKIMGREVKLRFVIYYISRQAMLETFGMMNKMPSIEVINDILIQFYELKRQKKKRKMRKTAQNRRRFSYSSETIYKIVGLVSFLATGFLVCRFCLGREKPV